MYIDKRAEKIYLIISMFFKAFNIIFLRLFLMKITAE